MKKTLTQKLQEGYLFFDGAFGSEIAKSDIPEEDLQCSVLLNKTHPDLVRTLHEAYLKAGCDVVTTNTFTANPFKAKQLGFSLNEIVESALSLAKQAINEAAEKYIAFDIGPSGKLMAPMGECTFEEMYEAYKTVAVLGEKYGADMILFETFSDIYELKTAVLAAKENTTLPVLATMTLEKNLHTLTGSNAKVIASVLEDLNVDAFGFNCSLGPKELQEPIAQLVKLTNTPVMIQPNAGLPKMIGNKPTYEIDSEQFAHELSIMAKSGVSIFGGCCGTTPEHIEKAIKAIRNIPKVKLQNPNKKSICSYQNCVYYDSIENLSLYEIKIDKDTDFSNMENGDYSEISDLAFEALDEESDAIILNINHSFGNPQKMISGILTEIQSMIKLPILLKCKDPSIVQEYYRKINGKGFAFYTDSSLT